AAQVRTDLDRFSNLETSVLIRHGYCVGRKACRDHPNLFDVEVPAGEPWDPTRAEGRSSVPVRTPVPSPALEASRQPSPNTAEARKLQASALRRIWSSLF